MLSVNAELIWQGRIHLGDEPGVFGDAFYSGLCTELTSTIEKLSTTGPETTVLVIETENVKTFSGYPGHLLTVVIYEPDTTNPNHFKERVLANERLTTADNNRKEITVDFSGATSPHFVSLRVRVDTQVPPGLYDDFVVRRFSNKSTDFKFVASFGFKT